MPPAINIYKDILHHITVSADGSILSTNNTIFTLIKGENIKNFHPIFISTLPFLLTEKIKSLTLPSLSITANNAHFYCDVHLIQEPKFISIMFFNYSKSYNEKQQVTQKINERLLTNFKNKL